MLFMFRCCAVGVRVVVAALFLLFRLFCEQIGSLCLPSVGLWCHWPARVLIEI